MEFFFALVVFGVALALLFGPLITSLVVAARSRENRRRIETLESEVARLRAQLGSRVPASSDVSPAMAPSAAEGESGEEPGPELEADRDLEDRAPVVGSTPPELLPETPLARAPASALGREDPAPPQPPSERGETEEPPLSSEAERPARPPLSKGEGPDQPPLSSAEGGETERPPPSSDIGEGAEPPRPSAEGGEPPPGRGETAPPQPPSRVDWEQWVGVRGAAVVGGAVLALAALLFLRYSIERGLIPPIVRVAIGFLVGIGAVTWAERLRPRGYGATANALAGSGVVILYGATWASRALYDLVPGPVAWGLMILITGACGMLAWRHRSLVIATLGLIGGFATPLLLATGTDRPIALFSYLLLLDLGLLVLARRRGWTLLVVLSLVATAFYQIAWVAERMRPEQLLLALAILAVFAAAFTLGGPARVAGEGRARDWTRAAATLFPFTFALHFAGRADLGIHLAPVAALLVLLSIAALALGPRLALPWLGLAAAAADLAVVLVWVGRHRFDRALAWEATAIVGALALVFHGFLEAQRRRGDGVERDQRDERTEPGATESAGGDLHLVARAAARADALAAALVAAGGLALLILASGRSERELWPWLAGWLVLGGVLIRQSVLARDARPWIAGALETGLAFVVFYPEAHGTSTLVSPSTPIVLGLAVAAAAAAQGLGIAARRPLGSSATRGATLPSTPSGGSVLDPGAFLLPLVLLAGLLGQATVTQLAPTLHLAVTLVLAFLAVQASTRLGSGLAYLLVGATSVLVGTAWTSRLPDLAERPEAALLGLALQGGAVVLFTFWPMIAGRAFLRDRWAWTTASLAGPAWFWSLKQLWEARFGDGAIGLLPVLLGALSLTAALRGRRIGADDDPQRRRNLVWFAAVALGFISLAIPLQLEKEWVTIGWALNGLALLALWRRLDHPGLKAFALALLATVTARLLLNPAVVSYHPETWRPIVNWLMYAYLVPAACLLGSAALLAPLEVSRQRAAEAPFYAAAKPIGAMACGLAAILVVFAWINLTILDAFAVDPGQAFAVARQPARDLTLSLAWALYALGLLALGMRRRSVPLRWISLGFLLLTIGKVFLYDLGELDELYRVASLVGLAASLILVSLAYQRFVFGAGSREGPPT